MGRSNVRGWLVAAVIGAAVAVSACSAGVYGSSGHQASSPAAHTASSAAAPKASASPQTPGAGAGAVTQIQGPMGEPPLNAKCQMQAPQGGSPTFMFSLSSANGQGQGVQDVGVSFATASGQVSYSASFYPVTVPDGGGWVSSTTTAVAYPPSDPMPTSCRLVSYNE